MNLDETSDCCLSGGADGSDLQWGMTAGKAGHAVIHWTFDGMRSDAPRSEITVLPEEMLKAADPHCLKANETLKRYFPQESKKQPHLSPKAAYIRNLLRRNWYQVCFPDSCYGISTFKLAEGISLPIGTEIDAQVDGGTAWATQMFIDRFNGGACNCYIFDQIACYWFKWEGKWTRIYEPPAPKGIWAGIGTRKLQPIGKLAVRTLMGYKPDGKQ